MAGLQPPIAMALARDVRDLPTPDPRWIYEPKFDGWRALAFTASGVLQSRRDNNLDTRFPEIVNACRDLGDLVVDGELVALRDGKLDFGALTSTPASRAAAGITIYYVVFDLLAHGDADLRDKPYRVRRTRLAMAFQAARPPLQLVPSTTDETAAMRWMQPDLAQVGIEGIVVKDADKPYRAGRTGDWRKVRQRLVVDAIVIGATGRLDHPDEFVLARPDDAGELHLIGLSLPLSPALRDLAGLHLTATREPRRQLPGGVLGQPGTEYQPVEPTLLVEAETEPTVTTFNNRLRPRIHRLRPDLTIDDLTT